MKSNWIVIPEGEVKNDYYDEEEEEYGPETEEITPITKVPNGIKEAVKKPNIDLLQDYPSRSVNTFPDSKIVIRSDFCSGNLSKAMRG